ncbi:MAG: SPOR domain-containing protein [Bacteroidetes bacterium]|nr:SPOR domain-containing protein [Bacteroidota bacterium]
MNKGLLVVLLLMLGGLIQAQAQRKNIVVERDEDLDSLIYQHAENNKSRNTLDGFRIQLFSGSERNNANQLKAQFLRQYPEVPVYLSYQQPFFKLRAGDFRTRTEAQNLYHKLVKDFGEVLIVPDKINYPIIQP